MNKLLQQGATDPLPDPAGVPPIHQQNVSILVLRKMGSGEHRVNIVSKRITIILQVLTQSGQSFLDSM